MLSAGPAGVVARTDADAVTVGLADAATGGDKTAAAACGANGDATTSRVVTNPAPTSSCFHRGRSEMYVSLIVFGPRLLCSCPQRSLAAPSQSPLPKS
jgi:hypothetical protein